MLIEIQIRGFFGGIIEEVVDCVVVVAKEAIELGLEEVKASIDNSVQRERVRRFVCNRRERVRHLCSRRLCVVRGTLSLRNAGCGWCWCIDFLSYEHRRFQAQ